MKIKELKAKIKKWYIKRYYIGKKREIMFFNDFRNWSLLPSITLGVFKSSYNIGLQWLSLGIHYWKWRYEALYNE